MQVSWDPGVSVTLLSIPLPPRRLCPQIYFWEAQRQNLTERVKTLFLAETGVKLKNLTGYTTYLVSVAAFNAAGEGPRSTPTRGQTQQAGGETAEGEEGLAWGAEEGPLALAAGLMRSGGSNLMPPPETSGLARLAHGQSRPSQPPSSPCLFPPARARCWDHNSEGD
ncbi:hypothetical protein QTO34_008819 [Cnephaeus nilssonii]|uniref:Fibronectin type-III domain-containing protein n=1 Tax=Cnephaeus nilssonii TaxID=3371016 RepID=A0AA40HGN2_CNENI|nr:hypothetical protein QTO34_008819 [Eptesicus nilssonii]